MKILDVDALVEQREALRAEGKRVVQCHGCFDIVHPGHIRYLRFASEQGDVLIVSVSSDAVVGKGIDRPYITEDLRLENLAALEFVDYVVLDDHPWAGPILEAVKPDVYLKGKEYETNRDPRFLRERELVESYGGRVIFGSGDVVFSSTAIISRYREKFDMDRSRVDFYRKRHDLTPERLTDAVKAVHGKRVVVLADAMLDVYVQAERATVASEAPVLSVTPLSQRRYVGGGALIARQLATLGADVTLLTVLDDGDGAMRYREAMARTDVTLVAVPCERRPTPVKTRYLVGAQKVFKVDEGVRSEPPVGVSTELVDRLTTLLAHADALVATDFGYGLFGTTVTAGIRSACEATSTPSFVDVSGNQRASILKFAAPTLAAPTEEELRFAFGDRESGLSHLASAYFKKTGAAGLVVTMGARGSVLFHPSDGPRLRTDFLPALDALDVDSVGAGDVFLSGLVAAELAGADRALGLYLGTTLAAEHVSRLGNDPVPLLALSARLDEPLPA
jgi:rfaE bifunctional protein kinase chain/domain/rfaE bifunctional protein nucleotidyltransferase chain/domain